MQQRQEKEPIITATVAETLKAEVDIAEFDKLQKAVNVLDDGMGAYVVLQIPTAPITGCETIEVALHELPQELRRQVAEAAKINLQKRFFQRTSEAISKARRGRSRY